MANRACTIGDNYLPASFNGVPFYVLEATSEHGRRGAEGEFPFSESTAYADLGRRIRTYTITAEFREDNHVAQVAALIAACELPGPGILVHPTRGIISAACKSIHVTDNLEEEAGITHVELEFVEGNAWPNGLSLVGTLLGLSLNLLIEPSRDSFRARYRPKQVYYPRRTQVIQTAQDGIGIIADRYSRAIQSQRNDRKTRALSELRAVQEGDVSAADPVTVDRAMTLGSAAVASELKTTDKFNTFRSFANWATAPVMLTGIAGDSQDAVYSHMRLLSAAFMSQAALETDYARVNDALQQLDTIVSILDEESENAKVRCDNVLYIAIEDFKVQLQTLLYQKSYNSPKLLAFDFHGSVHPLVAAYSIHGDAKRLREIQQRNVVDMTGRVGPTVIAASNSTTVTRFDRPVLFR